METDIKQISQPPPPTNLVGNSNYWCTIGKGRGALGNHRLGPGQGQAGGTHLEGTTTGWDLGGARQVGLPGGDLLPPSCK